MGQYYNILRSDILALASMITAHRVLDVGCGVGLTEKRLKEMGVSEVVGIELVESVAEEARKVLDQVFVGNAENMELPYPSGYFDCIIYGDVLEHMLQPVQLLKRHRSYIGPNGFVIASIPNIRNYRVLIDLIVAGEWEYKEAGILDAGHLRFFTLKSSVRLFETAGYTIVHVVPALGEKRELINKLTLGIFSEFLAPQFLIMAKVSK